MTRNDLPIGVFDSGLGGLSVLGALRQALPGEHLLYLGDTARVPYGSRSPETVRRYAMGVAGHLVRRGVKALVVACNTATTYAIDDLRRAAAPWGIPVVGVIAPGVEQALAATSGHVAVIGTEGTVRGGAYRRALLDARPGLQVTEIACPLFVALAEEGWTTGDVPQAVARRYLAPILPAPARPDTLVLGCTHYPLLAETLRGVLPGVALIDSGTAVSAALQRLLRERGLERASRGPSEVRYLVTDHPERFAAVGAMFLGGALGAIELVDLVADDHEAFRAQPAVPMSAGGWA